VSQKKDKREVDNGTAYTFCILFDGLAKNRVRETEKIDKKKTFRNFWFTTVQKAQQLSASPEKCAEEAALDFY